MNINWTTDVFMPIFTFILQLFITVVQVVTYPINVLIDTLAPGISAQLSGLVDTLHPLLSLLPWCLTFVPAPVRTLVLVLLGLELVFMTVFKSTYLVSKMWLVMRMIKFF